MASAEGDFTGRAEAYSKYRPSYPPEIIRLLNDKYGFTREMVVADIGCGTGILAAMFLENGNPVVCVDPNEDMLSVAKKNLSQFRNATFVNGKAEATHLNDHSVNVVTAGQAFHWFDEDKAKREFRRILKAPNLVVLIWNDRDTRDPVTEQYEEVIREFNRGYRGTGSTAISVERIYSFFNYDYDYYQMDNFQALDLEGLIGRYLSNSYSLKEDDPKYKEAMARLQDLFSINQKNGKITLKYTTRIFIGRVL
ncbi:class I SAM-dependent methyltransferase [Thermoplasma sp.]|uniref:class I SAM-dependent methyltransferase n=1 Tax=Thermoplasma sp. TaxID=1973142 RepID=UPI00128A2172|nr:class I SAM-dependent methyltransferase [Thermoplasma sp.]KAA8922713.1 MAG: class I SAM-dependent methyltransferase [Thermoplasma sp.]